MPILFLQPWYLLIWLLIPISWMIFFIHRPGQMHKRGMWSGLLRSLLIFVLGSAVADPRLEKGSDRVNLFFCLDASRSITADQTDRAMEIMGVLADDMQEEDRAGLIVFGRSPHVEIGLTHNFQPVQVSSQIEPEATDIYGALQLALGKMPQGEANRIVLFSDGNQTLNESLEMAHLMRSLNTEIFPVPLSSWFEQDPLVMDVLDTPETSALFTPHVVSLVISSSRSGSAELALFRNETLLSLRSVELHPGKNIFHFSDMLEEQGLYLYRAQVNAPDDPFTENNRQLSFTRAIPESRVLYLSPAADNRIGPLPRALESQGLAVKYHGARDHPITLQELLQYNAVILDNVPARQISLNAMEDLSRYVKDMGGGLVMIGGENGFGAGRWGHTPLEEALPVYMESPAKMGYPGFALVLLIDKSASMSGGITAQRKIEAAKIAAFSSVEMLNPADQVGVLAFDTTANWIVPMTDARRRREIARKLSGLAPEGGTDLYVAMTEAFSTLQTIDVAKKHVIVLSDGLTQAADFAGLVGEMNKTRITISTVALGKDADLNLMGSIADLGGGRSYYAEESDNIPKIFASETALAVRDVILEKPIVVEPTALAGSQQILKGLPDRFPGLDGMVVTYAKPDSRVLLDTEEGPLLVAGTLGLGRNVAFTSGLDGRWGAAWVGWEHFGQFVSQMVKWVQRKETPAEYTAKITRENGEGVFEVDVRDERRRFMNNLSLSLHVLMPSRNSQTVKLDQTAPGKYLGTFSTGETGEYYLTLVSESKSASLSTHQFGYAVSYSDEFAKRSASVDLLEQLAAITGGRVLTGDDLSQEDLFSAPSHLRQQGPALWPYLVLLSLVLFIGDIIFRKVMDLRISG